MRYQSEETVYRRPININIIGNRRALSGENNTFTLADIEFEGEVKVNVVNLINQEINIMLEGSNIRLSLYYFVEAEIISIDDGGTLVEW